MENLIFYYGACLMGFLCLISMLAVYSSNKRVVEDLKHPAQAKDKWMGNFVKEHQKLLKENTEIHNPSVYVLKRMRGRKIGPWSIRQMKGISWGTFILSFLCFGVQLLQIRQKNLGVVKLPVLELEVTAMNLTVITGIGMGIVLIALRMVIGTGYQEEVIETNLLDYVENRGKKQKKAVLKEPAAVSAQSKEREEAAKQMEQGILEAAAADSHYSHLLNKEEEAIVKDVIKEFLA